MRLLPIRISPAVLCCVLVCGSAFDAPNPAQAQPQKPRFTHSITQAQRLLTAPSKRVMRALWRNDTQTLARFVHPKQGIRFSPYVYLDVKRARVWSRGSVAGLNKNQQSIDWGDHDALEETINLPWNKFRSQFLSPHEFSRRKQMTFQSTRSRGNTINNLHTVYPDADIVEFHVPGTYKKYGGMDWRSLWLVWRSLGKTPYLVAIAGDGWTT